MSPDDPPDPLSALAPLFRVRPELQAFCRFGQQWASPHDTPEPAGWAPFHLVTTGTCVLDMSDVRPVAVHAGDIALLPHGDTHMVRGSQTSAELRGIAALRIQDVDGIQLRSNTDQPEAELICGRLKFEQPHSNLARAALPALIVLRSSDDDRVARVHHLLFAIKRELDAMAPGARAICTDLASALLVMVLRIHFERAAAQDGLLRLLSKPQTARAAIAMLDEPARAWRLDEIAAVANTSRATLVRDFRRLAAMTPLDFLTDLRLNRVRHRLASSNSTRADVAEEAGYQ